MGTVYEATHARLAGRYAIKVLLKGLSADRAMLALFNREAQITSLLQHPNIVQVVDHNTTADGIEYLVMEYLAGESLAERLFRKGPLPLDTVVGIVEQIAAGLAAAHAHGIVHRDLKPDNVFLVPVEGREGESVKILDFGISKVKDPSWGPKDPEGALLGTPQYMSPEQVEGRVGDTDAATDQFALAVIAYQMLTGRNPFQGDTIAAIFSRVAPRRSRADGGRSGRGAGGASRPGQVEPSAVSRRHRLLRRASGRGDSPGARQPAVGDHRLCSGRGRQLRKQGEVATTRLGSGAGRRGGGEHLDSHSRWARLRRAAGRRSAPWSRPGRRRASLGARNRSPPSRRKSRCSKKSRPRKRRYDRRSSRRRPRAGPTAARRVRVTGGQVKPAGRTLRRHGACVHPSGRSRWTRMRRCRRPSCDGRRQTLRRSKSDGPTISADRV